MKFRLGNDGHDCGATLARPVCGASGTRRVAACATDQDTRGSDVSPAHRVPYCAHIGDLSAAVFEPPEIGVALRSAQARIAPFVGNKGALPGRSFPARPTQGAAPFSGVSGLLAERVAASSCVFGGDAIRRHAAILILLIVSITAGRAEAQQQVETQTSSNQAFQITPRAYVQFDWRGFPDWTVTPDTGRLQPDTLEIRRLRAGIDGRWRRWSFEAAVDPMDELDDTLVKDAYVQFRASPALRLRGGQFKLPGGREYGTSAASLDFLERSAFAQSIASGRDIGAMASGRLGRSVEYEGGVFAGDGMGRRERAGLTTAGSVMWTVVRRFEVTGSFTLGRTRAVDSDPPNGFEGRTSTGYRFFEPLYVDGLRERFAADANWRHGPWRVTGEVLHATDARDGQGLDLEDLPALVSFGWSSAVTREFGRQRGKNRSRIHEWDLALRFDSLAFDDEGPETAGDSVRPRATNVRARGAQTLTTAASWKFSRWARVLAQAAAERYTEALSAPGPGQAGIYWSFGTRLQLEFP